MNLPEVEEEIPDLAGHEGKEEATFGAGFQCFPREGLVSAGNEQQQRRLRSSLRAFLIPEPAQRFRRGIVAVRVLPGTGQQAAKPESLAEIRAEADHEQVRVTGLPIAGERGHGGSVDDVEPPFGKSFPEGGQTGGIHIKSNGLGSFVHDLDR